jgi:hypothetical protein
MGGGMGGDRIHARGVHHAGDAVVVGVLYEGRGKGSGARTEGRFWYVFKYRSGRPRRWELYPERTQALEAAGLSE